VLLQREEWVRNKIFKVTKNGESGKGGGDVGHGGAGANCFKCWRGTITEARECGSARDLPWWDISKPKPRFQLHRCGLWPIWVLHFPWWLYRYPFFAHYSRCWRVTTSSVTCIRKMALVEDLCYYYLMLSSKLSTVELCLSFNLPFIIICLRLLGFVLGSRLGVIWFLFGWSLLRSYWSLL